MSKRRLKEAHATNAYSFLAKVTPDNIPKEHHHIYDFVIIPSINKDDVLE